jgi:hypothetical protein
MLAGSRVLENIASLSYNDHRLLVMNLLRVISSISILTYLLQGTRICEATINAVKNRVVPIICSCANASLTESARKR